MGLREKAVRGVAWSAARNWGSRAINFVVFVVLARLLPTEAFGLVALAGAYVALVRVFVDQGFADAIIQRDALTDAHLDTAFWVNLGLSVVFTGASIVAAPWIARLFGEPELAPVVQWLAPSFVLAALAGVQEALFERHLDYRTLAVREFIAALTGGIVGVAMAFAGYGVWSLVGMLLAERTAAVAVLWAASDWRPGVQVRQRPFVDLFSFGVNIVGSNLLGYVNRRADNLLIGYVLGAEALGFYDVAYRLLTVGTNLVTQAISSVAFSAFSRIQNDLDRLRQSFYSATQTVSVVAFPLFLGAAAVAPEAVGLLFGEKWLPLSADVFRVLAFIGILHSVFYFNAAVILARGKAAWRLGISAMNAVTNVIAFVIAVRYGIVAVAAAYVLRGYLLAPVELWIVRRLIGLRVGTYLRQFVSPAACALLATGLGWAVLQGLLAVVNPYLALGLGAVAGALAYAGSLYGIDRRLFKRVVELVRLVVPA